MLCYWAYWVANPASRDMPNSKYSAKIHQLSLTFTISAKNRITPIQHALHFALRYLVWPFSIIRLLIIFGRIASILCQLSIFIKINSSNLTKSNKFVL